MADEKDELLNLKQEFEWLLQYEVQAVRTQLREVLMECIKQFPISLLGTETGLKQERFILSCPNTNPSDLIKCVVTVTGDNITHADINVKLPKHPTPQIRTSISADSPWRLQQIQDAGNHLAKTLSELDSIDPAYQFRSGEEVLFCFRHLQSALHRGRQCLLIPRKRTIDELISSRNMKSLRTAIPNDVAVSFYLQSYKLVLAVYQLSHSHGTTRFDSYVAECSVPWLNQVLVLFTVGLQLCQQLIDKVTVFSQFKDVTLDSPASSAMTPV